VIKYHWTTEWCAHQIRWNSPVLSAVKHQVWAIVWAKSLLQGWNINLFARQPVITLVPVANPEALLRHPMSVSWKPLKAVSYQINADMLSNVNYTAISSAISWMIFKRDSTFSSPQPLCLLCLCFWQPYRRCFFSLLAWSPECHIHIWVDGAKWGLGSSCLPSERWD